MMAAKDLLIKAKTLIPDEQHWWRGVEISDLSQPEAVLSGCFCPWTAIAFADNPCLGERLICNLEALDFFEKAIETENIAGWNDDIDRIFSDIHEAFDRAIELASEESK